MERSTHKCLQDCARKFAQLWTPAERGSGLLLYCAHQSVVDALGYVGAGLPTEY
jgi:hypothetical protein